MSLRLGHGWLVHLLVHTNGGERSEERGVDVRVREVPDPRTGEELLHVGFVCEAHVCEAHGAGL